MINGLKFFSFVSEELQPKELRSYAEKILNLEPPKIEHCLHQLKK